MDLIHIGMEVDIGLKFKTPPFLHRIMTLRMSWT